MGLEGKVEEELDINSPADKFFKRLISELHHLPDASTKSKELKFLRATGSLPVPSNSGTTPSEVFKEKVAMDEENKTMTMVGVSGHVLEKYKAYKIVYQVFPKGESGTVKLSLIYEKFKETDGEPHNYLKFGINVIKDLDKHLTPKKG